MRGKSRLASALRQSANSIGNAVKTGSLHQFFKRIAYRKGTIAAVTATARKLAVIIYNMLTKKEEYKPLDQTEYMEKQRIGQLRNLQKKINQLKITPNELFFATT